MNLKRFWIDVKQPVGFQRSLINAYPEAVIRNLGDEQGDVMIELTSGKLILIEVKEFPNDFIASITDRRLFRQAEGMKAQTPWSFLLLSEDPKYSKNGLVLGMSSTGYGELGDWSRDHIDGALTAVQARGVMTRVAYRGYVEAVRLITHWVEGADRGAVTTEGIKLSPFDKDDQQLVNLLAWFEGIGVIQAKNFIEWCRGKGINNRFAIFMRAVEPFEGDDKPKGWTNHTTKRNSKQLENAYLSGELKLAKRAEWLEELDQP